MSIARKRLVCPAFGCLCLLPLVGGVRMDNAHVRNGQALQEPELHLYAMLKEAVKNYHEVHLPQ